MTIGQISLLPFYFAPRGWHVCNGQLLSIADHTELFSLLETAYGGDGRETFALPDYRGKEPQQGLHYHICSDGVYPRRP